MTQGRTGETQVPEVRGVPSLARRLYAYFTAPHAAAKGIETWKCWRFWLVCACYLLSLLVTARDPFFQYRYNFTVHSTLPLLIAFFLFSTLNWEMLLTGAPRGANLLLQMMMVAPGALLMTRILISPVPSPAEEVGGFWRALWQGLMTPIEDLLKALGDKLPVFLKEFFSHPWLALMLVGLLLALSLRQQIVKLSAIAFFLVICLASTFFSAGNKTYFVIGFLLLAVGLCLQWNPYREIAYFLNVRATMEGAPPEDERFYEVVWRVMRKLYDGNTMESRKFLQIVSEVYAPTRCEYTEGELNLISSEISKRMLENYELVTIVMRGNLVTISPVKSLYTCNALLEKINLFARLAAVMLIAALWTIMPFDAIPDCIPFVGIFDDLAVNAMAMVIGRQCLAGGETASDN